MKKHHKRIIFIMVILSLFSLGIVIIAKELNDNIVFFFSPKELVLEKVQGKKFRIGGMVKEGSISIEEEIINFIVTDYEAEIRVIYKGDLPGIFREGQGVVVLGRISEDGKRFYAEELLTKHDERYMPKEMVDKYKERY